PWTPTSHSALSMTTTTTTAARLSPPRTSGRKIAAIPLTRSTPKTWTRAHTTPMSSALGSKAAKLRTTTSGAPPLSRLPHCRRSRQVRRQPGPGRLPEEQERAADEDDGDDPDDAVADRLEVRLPRDGLAGALHPMPERRLRRGMGRERRPGQLGTRSGPLHRA